MTEVLLPILTCFAELVMGPSMKTTFLASPETAAVNWAKLLTVVVVPPAPPVVPPFSLAYPPGVY